MLASLSCTQGGGLIAGLNFSLYKGFRMVSREGPWPCWFFGRCHQKGGGFLVEGGGVVLGRKLLIIVSLSFPFSFFPLAVASHRFQAGGSK
jgi:hypothetical protein